jgi:hypothetical protein
LKCAWAISEFFGTLKFHFRELDYIPLSRKEVAEACSRGTWRETEEYSALHASFPMIRNIFQ